RRGSDRRRTQAKEVNERSRFVFLPLRTLRMVPEAWTSEGGDGTMALAIDRIDFGGVARLLGRRGAGGCARCGAFGSAVVRSYGTGAENGRSAAGPFGGSGSAGNSSLGHERAAGDYGGRAVWRIGALGAETAA